MGKSPYYVTGETGVSVRSVCSEHTHAFFIFTRHPSHTPQKPYKLNPKYKNKYINLCDGVLFTTRHTPVTNTPRPPANLGKLAVKLMGIVSMNAGKINSYSTFFNKKHVCPPLIGRFPIPCMLMCDGLLSPFLPNNEKPRMGVL
ncbi:MAG: hypothetical protein BWY80_00884 [Firmicutes bacterium ADurb.Bin456]|nr:MAG: hypothetical protein BWY80_00884 [Firmicutes bacterium ADurb.Bin456]